MPPTKTFVFLPGWKQAPPERDVSGVNSGDQAQSAEIVTTHGQEESEIQL